MDVLVRARRPLARHSCYGMCFDSYGYLMQVTQEEYDALCTCTGLEVLLQPYASLALAYDPDLLDFWERLQQRAWEKAHA